ncbi:ABC transporter substrate-binding protein [Roseibacterium sp. SDUM158016]|uniref:ABC transporter substrate-binding protein n=1 Tax=Roseicyclus sediminis TaxID=2980997 RepID=UPI0021D0E92B|nr:ABC transporter substrate-binding protein [Roseibacterium sp. SDUM158016]MCU4651991.1 ABC transporter substrate-binding protein [Roseibacterium sp. SDUM158016]
MCHAHPARRLIAALLLAVLPGVALAQVLEDRRVWPGTGERTIRVISTADIDVFAPFVERIAAERPDLGIDYAVASSAELHRAIAEGASYDLAISSAMDLQFQLANDGLARAHRSDATAGLPGWARWRDLLFAFTAEPAVAVISRARFAGRDRPRNRQDLIALMRTDREAFARAVGTYDVRDSGLGYLFATQEARNSDTYWRLSELMGGLDVQLYCCSAQMIDDVASGRLALAYNVLGSYAMARIARDDRLEILALQDYATVMLRTAFIPASAEDPEGAGAVLDAILRIGMRDDADALPLPPLGAVQGPEATAFGPIRLGPGLLVHLDRLNREAFLAEWSDAMLQ